MSAKSSEGKKYLETIGFSALMVFLFYRFVVQFGNVLFRDGGIAEIQQALLTSSALSILILALMPLFISRDANRVTMTCGVTVGLFGVLAAFLPHTVGVALVLSGIMIAVSALVALTDPHAFRYPTK